MPGGAARGTAAVLGLLLTPMLCLTVIGVMFLQLLLSEGLHDRIGQDEQVLREERNVMALDMEELAAEYRFSPEPVMALISTDSLRQWNRESAQWLTASAKTGRLQEVTNTFDLEGLSEVLRSDTAFTEGLDARSLDIRIREVSGRISALITGKVYCLRNTLLKAAEKLASKVIRLPALAAMLQRLPLPAGLLCLLLCGLILLLTARRPRMAFGYIGAALMACGILLLCTLSLIPLLGIGPLLKEISPMLGREYHLLALWVGGGTGAVALVAGILGLLGILRAEKTMNMEKHREEGRIS